MTYIFSAAVAATIVFYTKHCKSRIFMLHVDVGRLLSFSYCCFV